MAESDSSRKIDLESDLASAVGSEMKVLHGSTENTLTHTGSFHGAKTRLSTDPNQLRNPLLEADTLCVGYPSSGHSLQHQAVPECGYFFFSTFRDTPFL